MHTCKNAPDSLKQIKNCADTLSVIKFKTSLNPDVNLNLLCANYIRLPEMFIIFGVFAAMKCIFSLYCRHIRGIFTFETVKQKLKIIFCLVRKTQLVLKDGLHNTSIQTRYPANFYEIVTYQVRMWKSVKDFKFLVNYE